MTRAYVRGLTFVALGTGCPGGGGASGSADMGNSGGDDTHGSGATATTDTGSSGGTVADGTASEAGTGIVDASSTAETSDGSDGADESSTGGVGGLDCDVDLECTGDTLWSRRFGSEDDNSTDEHVDAVAAMPDGGAVIAGHAFGDAVFDDAGTVTGDPTGVAFVVRLDARGIAQWVVTIDGEDSITVSDVIADGAGRIVVLGRVTGDLVHPETTIPGTNYESGAFVLGLDDAGALRFLTRFDSDATFTRQLALGPDDGFAITGHFYGSIDFGGNLLNANWDEPDLFVAMFEADGGHRWSRRFGDASQQLGGGVTIHADGDLVVAALDQGQVDFGDGMLPDHPNYSLALAELAAADGEAIWSRQIVAQNGVIIGAPQLASDGTHTYLGSGPALYSTVDFGVGETSGNFHLVALADGGDTIWSRSFSSDDFGGDGISALAASGTDSVVVGGSIQTPTDFGDGVVHDAAGDDLFVAKYDAEDGATEWVRFESDDDQGDAPQYTHDVAVAVDGRVYGAGSFGGIIDFGDGDRVSGGGHGGFDGWVAALAP